MPSTRDLRRRIRSIKNTSQITKAMQMVSAAKMRKAQNQAISARPYSSTLYQVLASVADRIDPSLHHLLTGNGSVKTAVFVLSTDKGLCGSLNTNLFRTLMHLPENGLNKKPDDLIFYSMGKKGRDFIVRTGRKLAADFPNTEKATFREAATVRKLILRSFIDSEIGEVYILYPRFVSTLRQEARLVKILPVEPQVLRELLSQSGYPVISADSKQEFLFEPSPDRVLDYALVHLLDTQIYQAMLETKASEHSARMIAMQNATDNARDLVADLTLTYNQVRQGAITNELLEISSAAAALE